MWERIGTEGTRRERTDTAEERVWERINKAGARIRRDLIKTGVKVWERMNKTVVRVQRDWTLQEQGWGRE